MALSFSPHNGEIMLGKESKLRGNIQEDIRKEASANHV